MRVVVAPGAFSGTLTAIQAAHAIAEGWARRAPADQLRELPMSEGGPGFVDVLHHSLGGDLLGVEVSDLYGNRVPAGLLIADHTAYVEAAQACGAHLRRTPASTADAERATSAGVGELVVAALDAGARRVVVGAEGTAAGDGGAGLLARLGATADRPLDRGASGLAGITELDLRPARARLAGVELRFASAIDSPLLGLIGTTNVHGGPMGVAEERKPLVDSWLEAFAAAAGAEVRRVANKRGAGAAGGLGFALLALGGEQVPGVAFVAEEIGLSDAARWADVVLTGEGSFDHESRFGTVPYGVAEATGRALRPCVVLAGQVGIGGRETRALGIESAYSMTDLVGERDAYQRPYQSLCRLAERAARTWSF